jgi:hypothetical protein
VVYYGPQVPFCGYIPTTDAVIIIASLISD